MIIAASRTAKWKTGFQWTWVGATFFWFAAATAAAQYHWHGPWWLGFAYFNGLVNVVSMVVAVALTLYSQLLYLRRPAARQRVATPTCRADPPRDAMRQRHTH